MHTTNYRNTFIAVSDDCPATTGQAPSASENKPTIASLQFEFLRGKPYEHTSDDVLFYCALTRQALTGEMARLTRQAFFSKAQACLRCSPLVKKFGWGIHHDAAGKIALYGVDTPEYAAFLRTEGVKAVKGMRSKKA
jgi:hypothetical protein